MHAGSLLVRAARLPLALTTARVLACGDTGRWRPARRARPAGTARRSRSRARAPTCAPPPTAGARRTRASAQIATWFGSKTGFRSDAGSGVGRDGGARVARDGRGERCPPPMRGCRRCRTGEGAGADALRLAMADADGERRAGAGHALDAEADARALMNAVAASRSRRVRDVCAARRGHGRRDARRRSSGGPLAVRAEGFSSGRPGRRSTGVRVRGVARRGGGAGAVEGRGECAPGWGVACRAGSAQGARGEGDEAGVVAREGRDDAGIADALDGLFDVLGALGRGGSDAAPDLASATYGATGGECEVRAS